MIIVGDYELLRDECGKILIFRNSSYVVYFAATHAKNGGTVHLQHYKSMPHVFVIFENHPSTETCYKSLANFANAVVKGEKMETKLEKVDGKGIACGPLDPKGFPGYSKTEVRHFWARRLRKVAIANGSVCREAAFPPYCTTAPEELRVGFIHYGHEPVFVFKGKMHIINETKLPLLIHLPWRRSGALKHDTSSHWVSSRAEQDKKVGLKCLHADFECDRYAGP